MNVKTSFTIQGASLIATCMVLGTDGSIQYSRSFDITDDNSDTYIQTMEQKTVLLYQQEEAEKIAEEARAVTLAPLVDSLSAVYNQIRDVQPYNAANDPVTL